jgi:LysM repeat protein
VKSAQGLIVAALMGAALAGGMMWALSGGEDPDDGEVLESERAAAAGALQPSFGAAALAKVAGSDDGFLTPAVLKSPGAADAAKGPRLPRRPVFAGKDNPQGQPQPVVSISQAYQEIIDRAESHFAKGDSKMGASLLRGVFTQASHRSDVDLVPQVVRLLEIEEDSLWRGKYVDYLVRRGAGVQAFESQLQRATVLAAFGLTGSEKRADLRRAWLEFSRAHDLASDGAARERVYADLSPLLARNVFSGRFSPLVETYSVKSGDNLTSIAKRYHTTSDAIRRLSHLSSDRIQPRVRLRLLPGKVEVFVDKSDFLLWVTVDDRLLIQRRVGIGKENRTPTGSFVVNVRQKDPTWYPQGAAPIPAGDPGNILGTRWLGFKNTDEVSGIGVHGTVDPSSIGRDMSNGCIRMLNEDVELVFDFVPYGTRVVVRD